MAEQSLRSQSAPSLISSGGAGATSRLYHGRPCSTDRYFGVRFFQNSRQHEQCKPGRDKEALVYTILSRPPPTKVLSSPAPPNSVNTRMFPRVPVRGCLTPVPLQSSCFGSFLEGQRRCQGLSGEITQLAALEGATTETQSQAQPGKSSCCHEALGSGDRRALRASQAPSSICKPQKASA